MAYPESSYKISLPLYNGFFTRCVLYETYCNNCLISRSERVNGLLIMFNVSHAFIRLLRIQFSTISHNRACKLWFCLQAILKMCILLFGFRTSYHFNINNSGFGIYLSIPNFIFNIHHQVTNSKFLFLFPHPWSLQLIFDPLTRVLKFSFQTIKQLLFFTFSAILLLFTCLF